MHLKKNKNKTLHNWRVRWHCLSKPIHLVYTLWRAYNTWVSSHRSFYFAQFQGADFHIIFYVNGAPMLCCITPECQYEVVLLIMFTYSTCWMWCTGYLKKLENLVTSCSSLIRPKKYIYWFEKKLTYNTIINCKCDKPLAKPEPLII